MSYELVWFKRDLRMQDHAPLTQAALLGRVRCIYVIEPELWRQPDMALQHFEFIYESLQDLDAALRLKGGSIEIHHGELAEVLQQIWVTDPFERLYSHEETGNGFTYLRDQKVSAWCQTKQIKWHEYPQFGVVRGLKNRDLWQASWEKQMSAPLQHPSNLTFWKNPHNGYYLSPELWKRYTPKHLQHDPPQRMRGGRALATSTFNSFLGARSLGYRGGISSPISAPNVCSRLSVYLTYGCISMREVVQQTRQYVEHLPPQASRHRAGLGAFLSRLYWHCHFIQKLESEPAIEWRNMHRGYDGLREPEWNADYFEALKAARTGWPMVDACVIMLRETGWLNFRMRAMLVSVASYPLWLHWRAVGEWLATQFLDYEPGIHWSQMQMQAGTTGMNTTRVYNPIKQAQDHDPHGYFVRQWLPHLRQVPDTWIFEPWRMTPELFTQTSEKVALQVVQPLLDLSQATSLSKQRLHARRKQPQVQAAKKMVVEKHASRRGRLARSSSLTQQSASKEQLGFDF